MYTSYVIIMIIILLLIIVLIIINYNGEITFEYI